MDQGTPVSSLPLSPPPLPPKEKSKSLPQAKGQVIFPERKDGHPKYQFGATNYRLKSKEQLQQDRRLAILESHLCEVAKREVEAHFESTDRKLGRPKKDPNTRPYPQGRMELNGPDSLKEMAKWLEFQDKKSDKVYPKWSFDSFTMLALVCTRSWDVCYRFCGDWWTLFCFNGQKEYAAPSQTF